MGNAINQDARAIWLAIRRHGGWWTVRQIFRHWSPTFVEFEIEQAVAALAAGGYLMTRDDVNPGSTSYAFTSECKPLPGFDNEKPEEKHAIHG